MGTMISKIVRTMSDIIAPLIFVYGAYVIIHGHMTPGGGFQGGAVFASGAGLLIVAFGAHNLQQKLKDKQVTLLESTGSLMFIGLGLAGLPVSKHANKDKAGPGMCADNRGCTREVNRHSGIPRTKTFN